MLGDHGFERALLAERGRILGAQAVEVVLGLGLFVALGIERLPRLAQFLGQTRDALRTVSNSSPSCPRWPPKAST